MYFGYSQSSAATRINWPGRPDGSVQLVCLADEKLNEKAAAGVHLPKSVRIVRRDDKLDVVREGIAALAILMETNVLPQDIDTTTSGASVEQFWELDFGIRASGFTWTVREAPPSEGGGETHWTLDAEGLGNAAWAVDGAQFESQIRSLGLSQAAGVDHVVVSSSQNGPIVSATVYFPALGRASLESPKVTFTFGAIDRRVISTALRSAERQSLNAQIKELDATAELPSLVGAIGGRRVRIRRMRPAFGERLEFTIEADLLTSPPIPVDLICQPLANGRMAVVRVESSTALMATLLGPVDARSLSKATSQLNEALASAANLADAWADVVGERAKLLGIADLPPDAPEIAWLVEDLRSLLHGSLRAKAREAADLSHLRIDEVCFQAAHGTISSFIAERRCESHRLHEVTIVADRLREVVVSKG